MPSRHQYVVDVFAPIAPLLRLGATLQYLCLTWRPCYDSNTWIRARDLPRKDNFKAFRVLKTPEADTFHFVISSPRLSWKKESTERVFKLVESLPSSLERLVLHAQKYTVQSPSFIHRLESLFKGMERLPPVNWQADHRRDTPRGKRLPELGHIHIAYARGNEGYFGSLDPGVQHQRFLQEMHQLGNAPFVADCGVTLTDRVAANMSFRMQYRGERAGQGRGQDFPVREHRWADDLPDDTVYWNLD